MHYLKLTAEEIAILKQPRVLSSQLFIRVSSLPSGDRGDAVLPLSSGLARTFADELTEHLARTGFDEDYALTKDGGVIEKLIDRLNSLGS